LWSLSRTSQHFMEPEGSLQLSQELSTCPYPEPDQFSLHHPILPLQDPSYYYPPTYVLVFLVVSFHLNFPLTTYIYIFLPLLPIRATCPVHLISATYHSNYTWRRVQITKLLVMQFPPLSRHFILLFRDSRSIMTQMIPYKCFQFSINKASYQ
jgi:hypothetical protein